MPSLTIQAGNNRMKISLIRYLYVNVLCCIMCCISLPADTVTVKTGDTLHGTVIMMEGGYLTFKTKYAGKIKIAHKAVIELKTEKPVTLYLKNKKVLSGIISGLVDGILTVEASEGQKPVRILWNEIVALNLPSVAWHGNILLGANLQDGNTERFNGTIGIDAARKSSDDQFSIRLLSNFAKEGEITTARNTFGALKYDYFLKKKPYAYLGVEFLSDEFRDIELKTISGAGMGYRFIESEKCSFKCEVGLSYISENFYTAADEGYTVGKLAVLFEKEFSKSLKLKEMIVGFQSLEDSQFQGRNEISLASAIGAGWSLRLAQIFQYDNKPPAGIGKTDVIWVLGLQLAF